MDKNALENLLSTFDWWAGFFTLMVVIGVGGELFVHIKSGRVSKRLIAIQHNEEKVRETEIARLSKDAAEAGKGIAEANARAAEANAHAKSAEEHLAGANERASQAYERAAQAEKEAAKFNETAERERVARLQLEARMQPRRLNAEQKAQLASALRPFVALPIGLEWTAGGGQESADLASDVNDAIVSAGAAISGRSILADQYFKAVMLRAGKARMAEAEAVALFLIQEKLSPKPVTVQPLPNDNDFTISIGSKP